jgi:hypothetical protein
MNFGLSKTLYPKTAEGYLSIYLSLRDIDERKADRIFNEAMLNLHTTEADKFISLQTRFYKNQLFEHVEFEIKTCDIVKPLIQEYLDRYGVACIKFSKNYATVYTTTQQGFDKRVVGSHY